MPKASTRAVCTMQLLVGLNTVAADDPELICRLPGLEGHSPVRIVLDSKARMSPGSTLATSARKTPVWLLCTRDAPASAREALAGEGRRGDRDCVR